MTIYNRICTDFPILHISMLLDTCKYKMKLNKRDDGPKKWNMLFDMALDVFCMKCICKAGCIFSFFIRIVE